MSTLSDIAFSDVLGSPEKERWAKEALDALPRDCTLQDAIFVLDAIAPLLAALLRERDHTIFDLRNELKRLARPAQGWAQRGW